MQQEGLYPPGPTNWRRSLIEIQRSPLDFLLNLQRTYGNFVHYRHGPAHCYLINDPAQIYQVLVEDADRVTRPPILNSGLGRFLGNGLLISSGDHHHAQRKVIQPIFATSWIASYAPTMHDAVHELMDQWSDGDILDFSALMTELAMNIIYRTIFGTSPSDVQQSMRSAIVTLQRYTGEMLRRTPKVNEAEVTGAIAQLDTAVAELIALRAKGSGQSDFLSRLMESHSADASRMTQQQIRDETVTFFVAGHETTANALTWLFYLLTLNPDVERKLRETAFSASYVQQVIQEALRLYSPAWLIGRSPVAPYEILGYVTQPGDSLVISPFVLHRTSAAFPDPERFLPERFETEPPRYTFLPFGAGPHVCIGQSFATQEIAIALTEILRRWHLEWIGTEPVEMEALITLQPKHPVRMRVHRLE